MLQSRWQSFSQQPLDKRLPVFERHGRLYDVIFAQQFNRSDLDQLFAITQRLQTLAQSKPGLDFLASLLLDKRAMLFFVQPSTRTFLSFQNACHLLGMKSSEIRNSFTSSEVKGESQEDTVRMFASYVDLIIVRHFEEGFAEKAAWVLNTESDQSVPIINGGSGKDQHPTQALLDVYTLQQAFQNAGGINGKRIALVGDLKRGRTVRSLCHLLALYPGVEIAMVAPKEFAMQQDVLLSLHQQGVRYTTHDKLDDVISSVDAIYCTRLQDEYDAAGESAAIDYKNFYLRDDHIPRLSSHTVVMHPFPRRAEITTAFDRDPRALYWQQARNGMWVRAALILYLFQRETWLDRAP